NSIFNINIRTGFTGSFYFLSRFPDETVKTQSACGGNLFAQEPVRAQVQNDLSLLSPALYFSASQHKFL
ncbi:MAG: hypothetical protein PVI71_06125, partial [Desulfobacterales bacterium]